jgi:hypothetical protein
MGPGETGTLGRENEEALGKVCVGWKEGKR